MLLYRIVDTVFKVIYWLIIIRVLVSWIRPTIRDRRYVKALHLLYELTEPILEPIRRILPGGVGVDFSPLIAIFLLDFLRRILINILF